MLLLLLGERLAEARMHAQRGALPGVPCNAARGRASCALGQLSSQAHPSQAPALQGLTLKRHIDATLGRGRVREAVALPPGEDLNEWLAVNAVDFYNAIAVLYGTLTDFCTRSSCPLMSAGPKARTQAVHGCAGFS